MAAMRRCHSRYVLFIFALLAIAAFGFRKGHDQTIFDEDEQANTASAVPLDEELTAGRADEHAAAAFAEESASEEAAADALVSGTVKSAAEEAEDELLRQRLHEMMTWSEEDGDGEAGSEEVPQEGGEAEVEDAEEDGSEAQEDEEPDDEDEDEDEDGEASLEEVAVAEDGSEAQAEKPADDEERALLQKREIAEDQSSEAEEDLFSGGRRQSWGVFKKVSKGISSVGKDIGKGAKSVVKDVGNVGKDVGKGIGKVTKNSTKWLGKAAEDVGKEVHKLVKDPIGWTEKAFDDVTRHLGSAVDSVEKKTKHVIAKAVQAVKEVANTVGDAASQLGTFIVDAAKYIGNELRKLMPDLSKFFGGLRKMMCRVVTQSLGCDCERQSGFSASASTPFGINCYKPHKLMLGLKLEHDSSQRTPTVSGSGALRMLQLPGKQRTVENPSPSKRKQTQPMKDQLSKAPSGSCTSDMFFALEGETAIYPDFELSVGSDGKNRVKVTGHVEASLNFMAQATGRCTFVAERGLPDRPIKKMMCSAVGCIMIFLQGRVSLKLEGLVSGAVEAGLNNKWSFSVEAVLETRGGSNFKSDAQQPVSERFLTAAGDFKGRIQATMGPAITIIPLPGVPIDISPMLTAEIRLAGKLTTNGASLLEVGSSAHPPRPLHENFTVSLDDGQGEKKTALVQDSSAEGAEVQTCHALGFNLYLDTKVGALGLPKWLADLLSTNPLQMAQDIQDSIAENALNMAREFNNQLQQFVKAVLGNSGVGKFVSSLGNAAVAMAEKVKKFFSDKIGDVVRSMKALLPDLSGFIKALRDSHKDAGRASKCWNLRTLGRNSTQLRCKGQVACNGNDRPDSALTIL